MANPPYISLNEAAKRSGWSKSAISKALKNGKMSFANYDPKTGYDLDPAEVDRVFPKKQETGDFSQIKNTGNPIENSPLAVEVKMLREQIERMDDDREREREQLTDQIGELRQQIERQSTDHRQALAVLADQRKTEKGRGLFGWFGKRASA